MRLVYRPRPAPAMVTSGMALLWYRRGVKTGKMRVIVLVAALGALGVGCRRPATRFESAVRLVSKTPVQHGPDGAVTLTDYELEWDPCPGDQLEYVRGGRAFSACMAKYDQGDYLPVEVVHYWDTHGFYRWDVYRVGDCTRDVEPDSEGTFDKSQHCTTHKMYGEASGFDCDRTAPPKLVAVCPWLARR